MKILVITILSLFLGVEAQSRVLKVNSYRISGLNQFAGKSLSVFYVSGRPEAVGTSGQELVVNVIKNKGGVVSASIPSSGEVQVPDVEIDNSGIPSPILNYALFVVHAQPQVYIRNPNCGAPKDPRSIPSGGKELFANLASWHIKVEALSANVSAPRSLGPRKTCPQ